MHFKIVNEIVASIKGEGRARDRKKRRQFAPSRFSLFPLPSPIMPAMHFKSLLFPHTLLPFGSPNVPQFLAHLAILPLISIACTFVIF